MEASYAQKRHEWWTEDVTPEAFTMELYDVKTTRSSTLGSFDVFTPPWTTCLLLSSIVPVVGVESSSQFRLRATGTQLDKERVPPGRSTYHENRDAVYDGSSEKHDQASPDLRKFISQRASFAVEHNANSRGEFPSHGDNVVSKFDDPISETSTDGTKHKADSYRRFRVVSRFKRQPQPTTLLTTVITTKVPAPPEEAVVQTRPDLVHPPFTTYFFSVTLPCVAAWIFVTWLCLWICRPHSPLYREILKRLIEHSQMKQKSVLFAATVLAGERKPPEEPTA